MHLRALTYRLCSSTILALILAFTVAAKDPPQTIRETGLTLADSLADSHKVVYVDFFASWCAPCALSFPFMKQLHHRFADSGLTIIAVDLDKDSTEANEFLERVRPPFNIVLDPKGDLAKKFDLKAVPSSFIFGRDGTLRESHRGFVPSDSQALRTRVEELLKEQRKP